MHRVIDRFPSQRTTQRQKGLRYFAGLCIRAAKRTNNHGIPRFFLDKRLKNRQRFAYSVEFERPLRAENARLKPYFVRSFFFFPLVAPAERLRGPTSRQSDSGFINSTRLAICPAQ